MPRKKQTKEELLQKAKLARKNRYAKIKSDPTLYALQKEKEHQRYLKRKAQKKLLSIGDLTPRAKREQRKKWRENFNAFYQRKRLRSRGIDLMNANTPSCSDNEDSLAEVNSDEGSTRAQNQRRRMESPQPSTSQTEEISDVTRLKKKLRKLRYIILQNRQIYKNKINILEKKIEAYKKHINRLRKRLQSPNTKVSQLLNDKSKRLEIKKKVLFGEAIKMTLEHNYKKQSKKDKKTFSNTVIGDKSIIKDHRVMTELKNICVRDRPNATEAVQHFQIVRQNIQKFYERDDVSRMTAGKKEIITRGKTQKQKRYLLDSLKNLHKIFQEQNNNCKVSYSFFCKQRPFWILIPDVNERDTCVCKIHANIEFLIQALNKRRILSEKTPNEVIKNLCCQNTKCLLQRCRECRNKYINYLEFDNDEPIKFKKWENKKTKYVSKGKEKEKRVIEKIEVITSPKEAITELEKTIFSFIKHEGTRRWQFSAINDLKNNLKENEAIIHIDFSENYSLKYASEVQSFHFGGSRNEVCLHTAVIYYIEADNIKCTPKSICTVSENLRHDAAAVWAHIVPLLEYIKQLNKNITTLHFLSDSPSSQYRNKTMFFIMTKFYWYFSELKQITWNYSESGHGKGAADGVGGTLKRIADAAVAQGKDVATFESFVNVVTSNTQKIEVIVVENYQIHEKDLLIPKTKLLQLKGTLNVHQVIWQKGKEELVFREASCFVCIDGDCTHTKLVGKLSYKIHINDNKENESPEVKNIPSKVVIQSNILIKPADRSTTEVTRLSDIIPDNKLHLYPNVDINVMLREYNISNATASFSGCFEDFAKCNRSTPNICQEVSRELQQNPISDSDSDDELEIFPKKKNTFFKD